MNTENKQINLLELAQVLTVNPSWLGATLQRAGLVIQVDGTVSATDFTLLLTRAVPKAFPDQKDIRTLISAAGAQASSLLNTFNLTVMRPIDGNLWRIIRPDEKEAMLKVHISTAVKTQTGQIGFSLALPESPCRWALFVLAPWQRYALKNVEEIRGSKRSERKNQSTIFVTFSSGVFKWDLDNRIDDFLADPLAWS